MHSVRMTLCTEASIALALLTSIATQRMELLAQQRNHDHGCRPAIGLTPEVKESIGQELYEAINTAGRKFGYKADLAWAPMSQKDSSEPVYAPHFIFKRYLFAVA